MRDSIDTEIHNERIRQDKKFGVQNHTPFIYLSILGEEVGEACQAANDAYNFKHQTWDNKMLIHYREELVQVAAVAKAMIECIDRQMGHDL